MIPKGKGKKIVISHIIPDFRHPLKNQKNVAMLGQHFSWLPPTFESRLSSLDQLKLSGAQFMPFPMKARSSFGLFLFTLPSWLLKKFKFATLL